MSNSYYNRGDYTVNPKSWATITLPSPANYFYLINMSAATLYFSANRTPTAEMFDMQIPASGARMHVEPYGKNQVQIYNNGSTAANFTLVYFTADFDPLVLALSALETLGGGSSSSGGTSSGGSGGIITGFESPLPSGSNTIGNVNLNSNTQLSAILSALQGATPAGSNKIGSVDIANSTQLASILTELKAPVYGLFSTGTATSAGVTVTATSGRKITAIPFLSNDGDTDITLTVGNAGFTLKSGEVLSDFPCYVDSITIIGNSVAYRMAYSEKDAASAVGEV